MSESSNQNLVFYAVYCLEFDKDLINKDVLCQIRQELFTTGNKIRNKINVNIGNEVYKYSYVLSPKSPLKWKMSNGSSIEEKSFIRPDGSYSVVTQDEQENFVSKNLTFSHDHKWIYTQYFNKENKKTPVLSLTALSNNIILLQKRNSLDLPIKVNLVPCDYIKNDKERKVVNDEFGEPEVLAVTNMGLMYYCDSKIAELRQKSLEKFRNFQDEDAFISNRDGELGELNSNQNIKDDKGFNQGFKINTEFIDDDSNLDDNALEDTTEFSTNIEIPEDEIPIDTDKKDTYDWGIQQNYTNKNFNNTGFSIDFKPVENVKSISIDNIKFPELREFEKDIQNDIEQELSISKDAEDVIKQAETIKDKLNETVDSPSVEQFISDIANESEKEKKQIESFFEEKIKEIEDQKTAKKIADKDDSNKSESIKINHRKNGVEPVNSVLNSELSEVSGFDSNEASSFNDADKFNENNNSHYNVAVKSIDSPIIVSEALETRESTNERTDEAAKVYPSDDYNSSNSEVCSGAAIGCPYQVKDKININVSENERYYYFGEVIDNLRQGEGKTVMENGHTAYEGGYHKDKREGFGVYYYKTGRICHVGRWKNNKRHGTGIAFRPTDGTITVGNWIDDVQVGMGSSFDGKGNLLYAGRLKNGKRNGVGVSYNYKEGNIFVGQWENGNPTGKGTQFDANGNLLYTGGFKDQKRDGFGTQYNENGEVVYTGNWKDDKYEGFGSLHLENGNYIKGIFADGNISHDAQELDEFGFKIYEGEWSDNKYNGKGCKYFKNGGRYEGRFVNGEPQGYLCGYDSEGELVYEGEWKNDMFNGNGSYYVNGEKVYDGSFVDNQFHGNGFEYQDGIYVYSGGFRNSRRYGFGTSYSNGKPVYSGTWSNDLYDGNGILFENGEPVLAGEFLKGKKNGRINVISNGVVCEERIYKNDALCYARKYDITDPTSVSLIYEGNIKNGMLNGLGTTFTKYGEKELEGLFADGKLKKSMKVNLRNLPPLPKSSTLSHTDYESYRSGPLYVVEKKIGKMIYTGPIEANGMPKGLGNALYKDHIYVGRFLDGVPSGQGVIYQNDGTIIEGSFFMESSQITTTVCFAEGIKYIYVPKNFSKQ